MSDTQPPEPMRPLVPPGADATPPLSSPPTSGLPAGPPAGAPGGWGPPPAYPAYPPPATPGVPFGRPLHKPGTIPLKPLTLTDFFDGAFGTVRRNPKATIGMGAMVTAGFMVIPIIGSVLLGALGGLQDALAPDVDGGPGAGTITLYAVTLFSSVFGLLASVVVAGLIVPVVTRAALGEKVSIGEAWRQVRGRLPALVGLALLELLVQLLLIGVLTTLGALLGYAIGDVLGAVLLGLLFFVVGALGSLAVHVKWFQLAAPSLVTERRGVFAAIARAGRLSGGSFWRILGILVLTRLVTGLVSQVISFPLGILGGILGIVLPDPYGPVALLLVSNLGSIASGAIVVPFTATVAVLQYLDQRFRREGFDLDLITHVQRRGAA